MGLIISIELLNSLERQIKALKSQMEFYEYCRYKHPEIIEKFQALSKGRGTN